MYRVDGWHRDAKRPPQGGRRDVVSPGCHAWLENLSGDRGSLKHQGPGIRVEKTRMSRAQFLNGDIEIAALLLEHADLLQHLGRREREALLTGTILGGFNHSANFRQGEAELLALQDQFETGARPWIVWKP